MKMKLRDLFLRAKAESRTKSEEMDKETIGDG